MADSRNRDETQQQLSTTWHRLLYIFLYAATCRQSAYSCCNNHQITTQCLSLAFLFVFHLPPYLLNRVNNISSQFIYLRWQLIITTKGSTANWSKSCNHSHFQLCGPGGGLAITHKTDGKFGNHHVRPVKGNRQSWCFWNPPQFVHVEQQLLQHCCTADVSLT